MGKRILFVTNNYTPYSGGVVSSINATIDQLHALNHAVKLITLNFLGDAHCDPDWVIRVPSLLRFRYKKNCMALPIKSKEIIEKIIVSWRPNIVHIHHPFLLGPVAIAVAKKYGIKTIFTYHTMYEQYAHYLPIPGIVARPLIKKSVLSFCKKVDQIIVPSAGIKQYLHEQKIKQACVLPSSLQKVFLDKPKIKKKVTGRHQLLYVGRFTREKNIPVLFDVLAKLPARYYLTLAGYGAYQKTLESCAFDTKKLSQERVTFICKPAQDKLLELYARAHLFLFPSLSDTQGLVLAESMAHSTPVIALNGMGQRDIINNGTNGYIVKNAREMAQKILHVSENQELYSKLCDGAWHTAQAYDPKVLVQKLAQLYSLQ